MTNNHEIKPSYSSTPNRYGTTAHILQHNPAKIYLLSKKQEHADEAQQDLQKYGDVSKVEWMQCDLEDLKQTNQVAKDLQQRLDRLDAVQYIYRFTLIKDLTSLSADPERWIRSRRIQRDQRWH